MKALQLHYTSCRKGQSAHSGFQFRALSAGIRPDEQKEIERQIVYRPPRDANPEPSSEEIERDFPKALRWHRLESGRNVLTRSCYSGRDYSGRWGNFFAHSLVCEAGAMDGRWPIDLYEWPGWRQGLEPDEDREDVPPPLPPVDLAQIQPAESFSLQELGCFLREEAGRTDLLASMGRALLLSRSASRAVVVRDSAINGLYWIACLQKLFPSSHAAGLSFSTYQDDPRGCADINATCGQTDFAFDEGERQYRFFSFDMDTGTHSQVPSQNDDYTACASRWMAHGPQKLAAFFDFMHNFKHREIEAELVDALRLFELQQGEAERWTGEQLASMVAFADQHASSQGQANLLNLFSRAFEHSGPLANAQDYESVIRFLARGAACTGSLRHRAAALNNWTSLVSHHLIGQAQGLDAVRKGWDCLSNALSPHLAELAAIYLEEPPWHGKLLQGLDAPSLLFLLEISWTCLDLCGDGPAWEHDDIRLLAEHLMRSPEPIEGKAGEIFRLAAGHPGALAPVSRMLAALASVQGGDQEVRQARLQIGRGLGRSLARLPARQADQVRKELDDEKYWGLLYGEWLHWRDQAEDPVQALEDYRSSVLDQLPGYAEKCRSLVTVSILEKVPQQGHLSLVKKWLASGELHHFQAQNRAYCLNLLNQSVPLNPRQAADDSAIELLLKATDRHGIQLNPNRPLLRRALAAIRSNGTLQNLPLEDIQTALPALNGADYNLFLDGFLQEALERVGNKHEHQKVLLATFVPSQLKAFRACYQNFFKSKKKNQWPECFQGALKFWLVFEAADQKLAALAPLQEVALTSLTHALGRLRDKKLASLQKRLQAAALNQTGQARWRWVQEEIARSKLGFLARLRKGPKPMP